MGHHHCGHQHDSQESQNLGLVFFLNFGFAILELIGGILSNSVALISDAIHDAGDALAIGLAWGLAKLGNKKRTEGFSYGYRRFSLLSSLIASVILIIGALIILGFGISRLAEPPMVRSEIMFAFAVLGVLVNGYAWWRTGKGKTMNERVISLHLLEDLLGWVAVLVGSVVIYFTGWYIVDALLALAIATWILVHGGKSFLESWRLFLQATPSEIDLEKVTEELKKIEGLKTIHDLHCWSLDGDKNVASCHLVLAEKISEIAEITRIKQAARAVFHAQGVGHVTLEVETAAEDCELENC